MRTAVRVPQLAEQLVEVPTIISYSSLQRTVEQHVDIPVPDGGGPISGLQGFSPLDRVQQRRLPPRNACLSGLWSRSLTLFQVDVFMVLSQDKVHLLLTLQLVLKNALMSLVKVFSRTFPRNRKKCEVGFALESEGARQCQPIHAGSSAPCSSLGVGHDPHWSGALFLEPRHG